MRSLLLIAFSFFTAVAFTNCAQMPGRSGDSSLTATELIALEKLPALPSSRPIQIEARFFDGTEVIAAPVVVSNNGQTAAVEIAAEVSYPTSYTLAKSQPVDGANFPITPATPTNFTTAPTGLSLKITPQIRGAFIELSGSVIFSWSEGNTTTASVGEGIGSVTSEDRRVTLTDNRHDLPVFGTRTTPFFIRALPGKTYTLKVKGEKGPIRIDITPKLRAPDKGDIASCQPDPNNLSYLLAGR